MNNQSSQRIFNVTIELLLCVKFNPRVMDAIVNSFPILITLFNKGTILDILHWFFKRKP